MAKGLAVVSGGMDSITLAHMLAEHDDIDIVAFDYGQKHSKELKYAAHCAQALKGKFTLIDLTFIGAHLRSALTSDLISVPDGHYAEDSMKQTVVPNRNAIMLNIAAGIAISGGYDYIATGVHAGDHFIYPDCRVEFIQLMSRAINQGNEGFCKPSFHIEAPFVFLNKQDIVDIGAGLEKPVDYSMTWSCYKGGEKHCGKCGTCTERKEAFKLSLMEEDPTEYEA